MAPQTLKGINLDSDYQKWIEDLSDRYRRSQVVAAIGLSAEQLKYYWTVGRDMCHMNIEKRWGQGVVKQLSVDLTQKLDRKGFSVTSLGYMKRFYQLYADLIDKLPPTGGKIEETYSRNCPQLRAENVEIIFCIPWTHHKSIIDAVKGDKQKALYYVQKTLQNGWGRATLENMIDLGMYEAQGKSVNNFDLTLPQADADLARDLIKGSYNFGFAQISAQHTEAQMKSSLVDNVVKTLIEFGRGFSFVGREYRLSVDGIDKYVDLLFYIIPLHRYCVVEVKITKLDFPDIGQLAGYMGMVDELLNTPGDNPSIGLLICRSKNNVLARYALSKINAPIGVAEYELAKFLPSPEEIEEGLNQEPSLNVES